MYKALAIVGTLAITAGCANDKASNNNDTGLQNNASASVSSINHGIDQGYPKSPQAQRNEQLGKLFGNIVVTVGGTDGYAIRAGQSAPSKLNAAVSDASSIGKEITSASVKETKVWERLVSIMSYYAIQEINSGLIITEWSTNRRELPPVKMVAAVEKGGQGKIKIFNKVADITVTLGTVVFYPKQQGEMDYFVVETVVEGSAGVEKIIVGIDVLETSVHARVEDLRMRSASTQ